MVSRTQSSGPFCLWQCFFFCWYFPCFFLLLLQQSMGTCSHKKVPLLLGDPLRELMFESTFKLKLNSSKLGFANWVYQDFNIAVKLCFWSWNGSTFKVSHFTKLWRLNILWVTSNFYPSLSFGNWEGLFEERNINTQIFDIFEPMNNVKIVLEDAAIIGETVILCNKWCEQ